MELLSALIKNKGITMKIKDGAPPHVLWKECNGYTITLACENKQIIFPFYLGYGYEDEYGIEIEMVISWLLLRSEAAEFSCETYCEEYDCKPEIARTMQQQDIKYTDMIKYLLGDDYIEFAEKNDY